jgi:hypothetical protein
MAWTMVGLEVRLLGDAEQRRDAMETYVVDNVVG